MSNRKFGAIMIAMVVLIVAIWAYVLSQRPQEIRDWLTQRGLYMVSMESRFFQTGPFWRGKNDQVYFVKAADEDGNVKIFWFKFGWGMSVEPGRPEDYKESSHQEGQEALDRLSTRRF